MIHIASGKDYKKKKAYINTLTKNRDVVSLSRNETSKEVLMNYALGNSLFGDLLAVIAEDVISGGEIEFSNEELLKLKESENMFIFSEDKLLAVAEKKYKKYGETVFFEEKKVAQVAKFNSFAIADAYGAHDKIKAWTLYREAIEKGIEPEAISGILFWKIKSMLLSPSKAFKEDELKMHSSSLVSLYHKSHRGEMDFVIGLEQFILASLSK